MIDSRCVVIVDPCFGGITGHWQNFCMRYRDELSERGYDVTIVGSRIHSEEYVGDSQFIPHFRRGAFEDIGSREKYLYEQQCHMNDLIGLDFESFPESTTFIFPTIYPQFILPILNRINFIVSSDGRNFSFKLIFQFPFGRYGTRKEPTGWLRFVDKLLDVATAELKSKVFGRFGVGENFLYLRNFMASRPILTSGISVSYYAASESLANEFSFLLGFPIKSVPMPAPKRISMTFGDSEQSEERRKCVKVGYFGHSSLEKGLHLLPEIFSEAQALKNILPVVHLNPNRDTEVLKNKILDISRVEVLMGHLSETSLLAAMSAVDIVLLPYDRKKYGNTPSAIFIEAVTLGKVVVIPGDTWMSREAESMGIGYTCFDRFDARAISKALMEAIDKIDRLTSISKASVESVRNRHNVAMSINLLGL
jgi:glycosyltransferase involved in cell wall biosynthesis